MNQPMIADLLDSVQRGSDAVAAWIICRIGTQDPDERALVVQAVHFLAGHISSARISEYLKYTLRGIDGPASLPDCIDTEMHALDIRNHTLNFTPDNTLAESERLMALMLNSTAIVSRDDDMILHRVRCNGPIMEEAE